MNHSVYENGTLKPRNVFLETYSEISGDRIYRNDGNVFIDVTKQTGINSSAIGYGLGIAIADINMDGYPDIYVGNDFHEDDYLYINQKNGTFKEEGSTMLMHTSQFSMGVDIADVNNDAAPEIISADMLPSDPYILRRSMGEDDYDVFNYKINNGYTYQYARTNFQVNKRNGEFSETGLYSGIAATDWSWAPLWADFDNDGLKDLFISNGIPKRMNDIDYINFLSNSEVQQKILTNNMEGKDLALINKFPENRLPNKFYKNAGNLSFINESSHIEGNTPAFSNGAVYADLDNDGDLDFVVNNIDATALLYENKNSQPGHNTSIQLKLKGPQNNINAVGSKLIVYTDKDIRTYEKFPVKGFMSSMEIPLLIGLDKTKVDSMLLIWPDNTYQRVSYSVDQSILTVTYQKDLPVFDYYNLVHHYRNETKPIVDITKDVNFKYFHEENKFPEFDREPLIPHMLSTEGPALAVADINHDGLDDVFIGSASWKKNSIFLQQSSGKFFKSKQSILDQDSSYEDVDACWVDVNNDGNIDLVVASGGNEYVGNDPHNMPRVYLNDGKTNFSKQANAFDNLYLTASCVVPYDFNGDGYIDLFIGGRTVPDQYGKIPQSYFLLNDKMGKFKDVTSAYVKEFANIGFVTNALWFDIDKDGDKDLLLSLEWDGIVAFINENGKFTKKILSDKKGWWNFILPCDIDNDGNIDLIAGNLGLNSRLKASDNEPVHLYYNDFDDNGKSEQILTYFLAGKEIPFVNKGELEQRIPDLKKRFLYADGFAKSSLNDLFTAEKLKSATVLTANYFSNALLMNRGGLQFETIALPAGAQLSSFKDAKVVNANNDALPDILLMGNYYDNSIKIGRYDADFGTILINKGGGLFECGILNGLSIKGQVRHISPINIGNEAAFILTRNNDSAMIIKFMGIKNKRL